MLSWDLCVFSPQNFFCFFFNTYYNRRTTMLDHPTALLFSVLSYSWQHFTHKWDMRIDQAYRIFLLLWIFSESLDSFSAREISLLLDGWYNYFYIIYIYIIMHNFIYIYMCIYKVLTFINPIAENSLLQFCVSQKNLLFNLHLLNQIVI